MTQGRVRYGGHLPDLWEVGSHYLPMWAEVYATATGDMAMTESTASAADDGLTHDVSGAGIEVHSAVYSQWMSLRDEYQKALGESAENLYDTAEALRTVVTAFADQDEDTSAHLRQQIVDEGWPEVEDEFAREKTYRPGECSEG